MAAPISHKDRVKLFRVEQDKTVDNSCQSETLREAMIKNSESIDETSERINRLANTVERMQKDIEDIKKYKKPYTM